MFWRNRNAARQPPAVNAPNTAEPPLPEQVDAYLEQVDQADRLASIDEANLADPATNPRILDHRVTSQDRLHRRLVDLADDRERLRREREHTRLRGDIEDEQRWLRAAAERRDRAISEACADADEASAELEMDRLWQGEQSPAAAARTLARSRRRWTWEFLGFAVASSIASAVGISTLAYQVMPAFGVALSPLQAAATGALVETILTLAVTRIIAHQAHLDTHDKTSRRTRDTGTPQVQAPDQRRGDVYPWLFMAFLLIISIALNAWGLAAGTALYGVVGVVGAAAAALFAGMAWVSSGAITDRIAANNTEFRRADWDAYRAELQRRASGDHIPNGGPQADTDPDPAPPEPTPWTPEALARLDDVQLRAALAQALEEDRVNQAVLDVLTERGLADTPLPDSPAGLTRDASADYGGGVALADDADDAPRHDAVDDAHRDAPDAGSAGHDAVSGARDDAPARSRNDAGDAAATCNDAPDARGDALRDAVDDAQHAGASYGGRRGKTTPTVEQVREYFDEHPDTSNRRAAEHFGTSEATIRRRLNGITHP